MDCIKGNIYQTPFLFIICHRDAYRNMGLEFIAKYFQARGANNRNIGFYVWLKKRQPNTSMGIKCVYSTSRKGKPELSKYLDSCQT